MYEYKLDLDVFIKLIHFSEHFLISSEYIYNMMHFIRLISFILITQTAFSQNLSGVWRGAMMQYGTSMEKATLIYFDLSVDAGIVEGNVRNEIYSTETFAIKKLKGTAKENTLDFKEIVVSKKTSPSRVQWCRLVCSLIYNPETGYLEGTYTSSDCRNVVGKIIAYRTEAKFATDEKPTESHHWFDVFLSDIQKGFKAPEIRKKERENFKFEPIYFDYDKAEIRPEHYAFLSSMIKVIEGHTDLRIKITGHTDADGSDSYNDDLSKRRAETIIQFFTTRGLSRDRLEFDFKGEKQPVDNNDTPEGKQRNRRVDFQFI